MGNAGESERWHMSRVSSETCAGRRRARETDRVAAGPLRGSLRSGLLVRLEACGVVIGCAPVAADVACGGVVGCELAVAGDDVGGAFFGVVVGVVAESPGLGEAECAAGVGGHAPDDAVAGGGCGEA